PPVLPPPEAQVIAMEPLGVIEKALHWHFVFAVPESVTVCAADSPPTTSAASAPATAMVRRSMVEKLVVMELPFTRRPVSSSGDKIVVTNPQPRDTSSQARLTLSVGSRKGLPDVRQDYPRNLTLYPSQGVVLQ